MARQRETWSHKAHQYAAFAAITMNLHSLLWCPLLMLQYGLGTFGVCYVIVVVVICYPVLYVESVLSQFTKSGNRGIFNCCPLFRGLSYSMAYFAVMVNLPQYSTVSHAIIYLFRWLEGAMPWSSCELASWAADNASCYAPSAEYIPCETVATVLARRFSGSGVRDGYPLLYRGRVTIVPIDEFNNASANCVPGTESAVTGFYDNVILGLGSGVSDLWGLRMDTVFISAAVFVVLFLLLSDGLPKMQYSLYALAAGQYALLAVLLGATVVRDGAFDGLSQLPVWKFSAFARLSLWLDVVAFAAFGIGLGGYGISFITAHNSFQNNFVIDLAYVLVLDTLRCLGTAAIVFFVLGSYARKTGLEIDQVMASNVVEDVAFAQIPEALLSTRTSGAVLPVFFFFVVFTGLGSLAGPYIKVLILEYLYYVVGFTNIIGELLVVFQLYGLERVMIDCDLMLERTPWRVLQVLWTSVIPMVLTIFLVLGLLFRPSPTFRDQTYTVPAKIIVASVALVALTFVPSYAYSILASNNFNVEVVKAHATRWRPADPQFAREYKSRLVECGLIVKQHRVETSKSAEGAAVAEGAATTGATGTFVVHTDTTATNNPCLEGVAK
ncbi:sodium-dependent dopamine transporter-like isoform X2 [Dermacentor albipictus]|uniref:sodium-dependent dopamine transporter-like isoform X2 n=1 Tax=Dermacentor albipictus TaxID=60249 RepID=UPI0031FBAE52